MSAPIAVLDGRVLLYVGDVMAELAAIDDDSVDCVVTSPPYWGLRDYGVDGQIGLEPTLGEHLAVMVAVFEEIRRVLKPTGTCWLNYGDCYASSVNGRSAADTKAAGTDDRTFRDKPFSTVGPVYDPAGGSRGGGHRGSNMGNDKDLPQGRVVAGGFLKPKDLCLVPSRLAIALQEAGWWIRSEIIWGKSNPMPESILDRPATSHEKIFLLVKDANAGGWWAARDTGEVSDTPDLAETVEVVTRTGVKQRNRWRALGYYYDKRAVRQGRSGNEDATGFRGGSYVDGKPGARTAKGNKVPDGWDTGPGAHGSMHREGRTNGKTGPRTDAGNTAASVTPDHVGHINHTRLDQTPRGNGRALRNYEPEPAQMQVWEIATRPFSEAHFATFPPELAARCIKAGCPPGGLVLDPFGGAGTTALVAAGPHRRAALIELNPEYAEIARRRIERDWMGPDERRAAAAAADPDAGPLFQDTKEGVA